jgi:hypothetical protein
MQGQRTDSGVSTGRLDDDCLPRADLPTAFGTVKQSFGKTILDRTVQYSKVKLYYIR